MFFEELIVYQRAVEFSVSIIDLIDSIETSRRHYRLIEQLESSCTSIALNIAEYKESEEINKMLSGLINTLK